MKNDYSIKIKEKNISWDPNKSTPSCKMSIKELDEIIEYLKLQKIKSCVDFGCGNGRNSIILKKHFNLTLIECGRNVEKLKKNTDFQNLSIVSYDNFSNLTDLNIDCYFVSFVFHTIPHDEIRSEILQLIRKNIKKEGILCIVSPKNDSKYTSSKTSLLLKLGDGFIKPHDDFKFSFYENLKQQKIINLLEENGFSYTYKIISKARNIIFAKPK
ncbi:methyltransferase domain-containing protein [Mariniphaga sp.]|uniref:methyltransferase domain-containing protein n=1 Tax=Mariniphaga sp. TaxID=1954475 RepID=UPI00356271E2